MADAVVPGWDGWRARLAGIGPEGELAHALVNLKGQGAGRGEEARGAALPVCDAALFILRRNQVLRLSNVAPNGVERLGELLNVQVADLVRFAVQRADELGGLDQPAWKAMWGTATLFHEDLIRYLFRPLIYLRTSREWAGLALEVIVPEAESFDQALLRIIDAYLDVLLRDELRELGVLVERTLPRFPVLREAIEAVDDMAIAIWQETLVRAALHFGLRIDGAVNLRQFTRSLYFVLSGVLKQATVDEGYDYGQMPRRGRGYKSDTVWQVRAAALASLRFIAKGFADAVANNQDLPDIGQIPSVWMLDRYRMQF